MADLQSFIQHPLIQDTVLFIPNWQWLGLAVVIFTGLFFSRLAGRFTQGMIHRALAASSRFPSNDASQFVLRRPISFVVMGWTWFVGMAWLDLSTQLLQFFLVAAKLLTFLGIVWAGWMFTDILMAVLMHRAAASENKFDDVLAPLIGKTMKVLIVIFGVMSVAELLNFPLSSLLAGLGIGGIAIAMAAKDTLSNFFGSITILIDRPFRIGDWVAVDDMEGTVESMGFRSTRIRTFYNSLLTVPNSQFLTAHVDNYGARTYRRIKTYLGLTYDTDPDRVEAFCEGIRSLIQDHPNMRHDYYHVYFNDYGPHSLNILLYCFLNVPNWGDELAQRHAFFLDILKLAKSVGVTFAFPTQTLFVHDETGEKPS